MQISLVFIFVTSRKRLRFPSCKNVSKKFTLFILNHVQGQWLVSFEMYKKDGLRTANGKWGKSLLQSFTKLKYIYVEGCLAYSSEMFTKH